MSASFVSRIAIAALVVSALGLGGSAFAQTPAPGSLPMRRR